MKVLLKALDELGDIALRLAAAPTRPEYNDELGKLLKAAYAYARATRAAEGDLKPVKPLSDDQVAACAEMVRGLSATAAKYGGEVEVFAKMANDEHEVALAVRPIGFVDDEAEALKALMAMAEGWANDEGKRDLLLDAAWRYAEAVGAVPDRRVEAAL